ncbi:MAG: hypothetical protein GX774_19820 [Armatimonadetes bacterium]|nr:hypothetical protein [Armatimonadota bacterium]
MRGIPVPSILGLAATLGLLLAAAGAARGETHTFPVESLRLAACQVREGQVVLGEWFDQGEAAAVSLEAEEAIGLLADPADGIAEAGCSGGRCVVRVDRALFPIRITRAGRYQRWCRGFFPQGGGWIHAESLDFGPQQWFEDCDGSTAGRWVWVKGPTYALSEGVHLLWIHNWHGGARLDKVLLLPEGAAPPEGLGPEAQRRSPARAGWVLTPALTTPGLAGTPQVAWPAEAGSGRVALSLSLDGGTTFNPVAQAAAPTGTAMPALQLRAALAAGPGGKSPAVGAPTVTYQVDPKAFVVLQNEQVRATFLRQSGALIGLRNRSAGVECLASADGEPPFALHHLSPGEKAPQPVPPAEMRLVRLKTTATSLTTTYRTGDGIQAVLSVVLRGPELRWHLDLENRSPRDVVEVECPRVPGVRLGARGEDDFLITPNWQGGVETADPARSGGGSVPYPTGGAMAWLDLYEREPAHGLALASDDPSLIGSRLNATAQQESGTLTFSITRYARVRPGTRWRTPTAILEAHRGDWHAAADAYRARVQRWMKRPRPPEWVREADGWYGLVTSADSNRILFRRIPEYLRAMRELGTHYIQVWGQMTGGVNCDALPYPNPVLGSLDEFRAAVREVRRWGGHITFYVSSQFWRVDYGDAPMLGSTPRSLLPPTCPTPDWTSYRQWAARAYDGSTYGDSPLPPEEAARYGTPWRRTILCPATPAWANDYLHYWCVSQYGADYGANGIYLDETSAVPERYCFAPNHGHAHHGVWGASLARIMRRMVEDGRRRDPNWSFAMEGCGDAVGQFADIGLISPASARPQGLWGANRRFAPEVYHYTFPHHILYDGVANGVYGGISLEDTFLNVHLHGNRYDSFSVQPAARYVALRQRTKQLLYRATFRDNVGVTTSDPAVQAKVNVLEDAQNRVRILNLANPQEKRDVRVRCSWPGSRAPLSGYYFDLAGNEGPLAVEYRAGEASFIAPTGQASTVLLSTRCEPLVRVPVQEIAAGDRGALTVVLTNPGQRPLRGRLALLGGLPVRAPAAKEVMLPPQSSTTVSLPLAIPSEAARGCAHGRVRFAGAGFTVTRPLELLIQSPFQLSAALRGQSVVLTLANRSQAAHQGEITVSGGPWAQPARAPFTLAAGGTARVTLPLPAGAALTDTMEVAATIRAGSQSDRQSLWLAPLVANAGFEQLAADGRPARWDYQNAELITTDTNGAAEGERCLKLSGEPSRFVEAHQALTLEPGGTYVARCKLRHTGGPGARIRPAIVFFLNTGEERYVYLEPTSAGPPEEWRDYQARFTAPENARLVALYLYNVHSEATAWYDDVHLEAVSPG